MFPKSAKRAGSMSSIKSGNRVSSSSYGSEHGIAKVDGVSGKALASTTCCSGSTSRMLSNSEDKILSRVNLAFLEETCKNDPPKVVSRNFLLSL
jgi:hypothetical protein